MRLDHLEKARKLDADNKAKKANDEYIQALKIDHLMSHKLIEKLQEQEINYVVAPYEADAQLAQIFKSGHIVAAIRNYSDWMLFGCTQVSY